MMSAVMHGDGLLAGDLAYNIHLGVLPIDWERIESLCDLLGLGELVDSLPLAYATEVGELGSTLSAGQVQRLLVARALYRKPKILLLDEALSNLNTDPAVSIIRNIKKEKIGLLLVTHNPELLKIADAVSETA